MSDPMTAIEDRKAQMDLGVTAYRMWLGAVEDGASAIQAFLVVVAWFTAAMNPKQGLED